MTFTLHVKKTRALFMVYASERVKGNRQRNKKDENENEKTKEKMRTERSQPRGECMDETENTRETE